MQGRKLMTADNIPLRATQTHAECGTDVRTIDDTRQAVKGDVRASVPLKKTRIFYPYGIEFELERRNAIEKIAHIKPPSGPVNCHPRCIFVPLIGDEWPPPEQPKPAEEWDETALHRAFGGDVG